ncbi:hypothetical protein [Rhodopseudomonas sp. B29]|uniref:hypothetical protein n=1 Tax=Rhodopseudomonas sp. B29 TaxID=95607 RepID=UPI00034B194F|nr:hypothetical protein [Rhodopseudomonas sp. B29]
MRAVVLAALGLIGCGPGTASAGLIDQPRGGYPVAYTERDVASAADPDLQRFWSSDGSEIMFGSLAKPHLYLSRIRAASGHDLVVTMMISAYHCGSHGCPTRVTTSTGEVLAEVLGCDDVARHRITDDGNVLVLCDEHLPIFAADPQTGDVPGVTKSRLWHNGSIVEAWAFSDSGVEIRYLDPRPGLPVNAGRVLFRGSRDHAGWLAGTAYTFSSNCGDAAYGVTGTMSRDGIRLTGAAPHRSGRGCDIADYTTRSPHARLSFTALDRSTN